jgi:hypothetical protein
MAGRQTLILQIVVRMNGGKQKPARDYSMPEKSTPPSSFYFLLQDGQFLHHLLVFPGHRFIFFFDLIILGR